MDIESVRRVSLARYLYELGMSNLKSGNDLHLFAGVTLLQDAVEAFLVAVGEHVGAAIDARADFDKYFVRINEKRAPAHLPFQSQLLRLNRIRVASKHHGIQPSREECERLALSVRGFFEVVTSDVFGAVFATVSALDLLDEGDVKAALTEAKTALERKDYKTVAIACRKVIYFEVERHYSIHRFVPGGSQYVPLGDVFMPVLAPMYAQSLDYIAAHVKDPTEYIVLDHGRVNQELLSKGIETEDFWNIWRLTPAIFRPSDTGEWIVRQEFEKLSPEVLEKEAEYLFAAAVNVALGFQTNRRRIRSPKYDQYVVGLRREEVPVYEKADRKSREIGTVPKGQTDIRTDYWVQGLTGDGFYWHINEFGNGRFLMGFVHNEDVDVSKRAEGQSG